MKTIVQFLSVVLGFTVFVSSAAILCTQEDYDFKPYDGPYPEILPAGYCLVTNGSSFGFKRPDHDWVGADDSESEERAVHWAWFLRERDRYGRHLPPGPPPASFRPVKPELCGREFRFSRKEDLKISTTVAESMWLWLNVPTQEIKVRVPSDVSKGVPIGEVLIQSKPEPVVTKTIEGWEIRFKEAKP